MVGLITAHMQEQFSSEVNLDASEPGYRNADWSSHVQTWDREKVSRALPTPPTSHSKELGFTTLDNGFGKIWISVSKSTLWMLQSVEKAMTILSTST